MPVQLAQRHRPPARVACSTRCSDRLRYSFANEAVESRTGGPEPGGRLARRDIYLRVDGDRWYVEDRAGGADGTSAWFDVDNEDAALERVRTLMGTDGRWREIGS